MRRVAILAGAGVFLLVIPALARPIRTNTPGTGIFIGSGVLGQLVGRQESGDAGEELWEASAIAEYRYTPATHWVFGVRVPYSLTRTLDRPDVGTESTSGLGDVLLTGKYRFYRGVGMWSDLHAALELGLELPTGETDKRVDPRLPVHRRRRLQPGSGSTDVLFNLVVQRGWRRFVYGGDVGYRLNTEGDGRYRFGDEIRANLDLEYVLLPWAYERPGNELFTLLEATFVHREADEFRDDEIRSTRRTEFLLAPGLQYIATEQLLFGLSIQLPVVSDVAASGLETDYDVLGEFRFAF